MMHVDKQRQSPQSAPTVEFGRYLKIQPHEGYVMAHCRKSSSQSALHPDVQAIIDGHSEADPHSGTPAARTARVEHQEAVFTQLKKAIAGINSADRTLPPAKDPYQDRSEIVRKLAFEVSGGKSSLDEKIDYAVDIFRPFVDAENEAVHPRLPENDSQYKFELDRCFIVNDEFKFVPDRIHYAGDILAQPEREVLEPGSGARIRKLVHDLEPVLLTTAVLRQLDTEGYAIYPSLAICRNTTSGGVRALAYVPLVALVNMDADIPLKTFALLREHPEMGSLIILSDTAMAGTLHLVLAEMKMKRLCIEMGLLCVREGILPRDLAQRLDATAEALFEYHKAWPYGPLMGMTTDFLYTVSQVAFFHADELVPQTIARLLQADASFGSHPKVNSWPCIDQIAWYLSNHVKGRFDALIAGNGPEGI